MKADTITDRTITLVGLMGAGKSSVGRRLATRLGLPFVDTDDAIEAAAGCTIPEIFERFGEAEFRKGERRVIERLAGESAQVMATGGGAFMDPETRILLKQETWTIWLRADLDVLVERTSRRSNRPLLKDGDPRDVLARLIAERYPVYAEADLVIDTAEGPLEETVERCIDGLGQLMQAQTVSSPTGQ